MKSIVTALIAFLVVIRIGVLGFAVADTAESSPDYSALESPDLKQAVAAGDWRAAINEIGKDSAASATPCAALLTAHAMHALGARNAAADIFIFAVDSNALSAWEEWTGSTAAANPHSQFASYLYADALRR